jgi:hypothetical protein
MKHVKGAIYLIGHKVGLLVMVMLDTMKIANIVT